MPPLQENLPPEIVSGVLGVKLDNLLLNVVVVFEARRIKGVTPLRAAEAAKHSSVVGVVYT